MRKIYGDSLRKDAGFVKVIKNVASKNAKILESRANKHVPELKRVVTEVKGTFDKVFEETAEAVEEFLAKCESRLNLLEQTTFLMFIYLDSSSRTQVFRGRSGHQGSAPTISGALGDHVRNYLHCVGRSTNLDFSSAQPRCKRYLVV